MTRAVVELEVPVAARPRLVFFCSPSSGRCRKVEGFLANVLQHRRNQDTFVLHKVIQDQRPDLYERFRITDIRPWSSSRIRPSRPASNARVDPGRSRTSSNLGFTS